MTETRQAPVFTKVKINKLKEVLSLFGKIIETESYESKFPCVIGVSLCGSISLKSFGSPEDSIVLGNAVWAILKNPTSFFQENKKRFSSGGMMALSLGGESFVCVAPEKEGDPWNELVVLITGYLFLTENPSSESIAEKVLLWLQQNRPNINRAGICDKVKMIFS